MHGPIHAWLKTEGQVSINMSSYVESMVENFPQEDLQGSKVASPWSKNLFRVQENRLKLEECKKAIFHTVTAQGLFLCKHVWPDISPAIAYPTPIKMIETIFFRMIKFLKQTARDTLTLRVGRSGILKWHTDTSFTVHPNFCSHTGATITMGQGVVSSISQKQGMNTWSSTEAEIVAADVVAGPMMWTKLFLEHQG